MMLFPYQHYSKEEMMSENYDIKQTALGARINDTRIKIGKPPVILQSQAYGYIPLESPAQLKQWQDDLRTHHGISLDASGLGGIAAETCSAGCSDACDMLE